MVTPNLSLSTLVSAVSVGLLSSGIDLRIYGILVKNGRGHQMASFISTSIAIICGFLGNGFVTFRASGVSFRSAVLFLAGMLISAWVIQPIFLSSRAIIGAKAGPEWTVKLLGIGAGFLFTFSWNVIVAFR